MAFDSLKLVFEYIKTDRYSIPGQLSNKNEKSRYSKK